MDSSSSDPGKLLQGWQRLPVVVRAILTGLVVFETIQLTQFIVLLNAEFAPSIPWGLFVAALVMWLLWKYFAGWGGPVSTQDSRKTLMRAHKTSPERRRLAWVAVPGSLVCMIGMAIVSSSLIKFPEASFTLPSFLGEMPPVTGFMVILGFSLAAGVSEEAGFRGYLQVPLEKKWGPLPAILFTAILFWLAHSTSASFLHRTGLLIGAGFLAGYLSYYSQSLIPAVIVHFLADAIGFVMVAGFFGLPAIYSTVTIWESGVTPVFLTGLVCLFGGGTVCIQMFRRMANLND